MAYNRAKVHRNGRPVVPLTAISDVARATFLRVYGETFSERDALRRAHLTRPELNRLVAEDDGFARDYRRLQQRNDVHVIERVLIERAKKGDVSAARAILPVLAPERHGPPSQVNINVTPDQLKGKSLEELRELRERLAKGR
jgi:hypothetical protein